MIMIKEIFWVLATRDKGGAGGYLYFDIPHQLADHYNLVSITKAYRFPCQEMALEEIRTRKLDRFIPRLVQIIVSTPLCQTFA